MATDPQKPKLQGEELARFRAETIQKHRKNRPIGSLNKATIAAQQLLREEAAKRIPDLVALCDEFNKDPQPCPFCGRGMRRNEDTRLRAITSLLDRGGLGVTQKIEIDRPVDTEWMQYATDEELDTVQDIIDRVKLRAPNLIEAEVVSDESE